MLNDPQQCGASINVPPWDGAARRIQVLWTLHKGAHVTTCDLWNHPIGAEVRVDIDGDLLLSEASRDVLALVTGAVAWRAQFEVKGWTRT